MSDQRPLDMALTVTLTGDAGRAVPEVEAEMRVQSDPTAAAFFDVDNTIVRGASIFQLVRGLTAEGLVTIPELVGAFTKQAKFVMGNSENIDDIQNATEAALSFVKGRRVADIMTVGERVFDDYIVTKLWPGTLALAQSHLDAGQRVWVVSATPVELAEIIAQRLGLTGGLGTIAESVDGVYTGRLVGQRLHGSQKAAAVQKLADEQGLDLARCSAYSDSANDIPMLSMVGHPVAVNPDGELRAYAKEHGWVIRDYRRRRMAKQGAVAAAVATAAAGAATGLALARRSKLRETPRTRS
jgi:HAD superfamily hydrolase (TIGR01490 family)